MLMTASALLKRIEDSFSLSLVFPITTFGVGWGEM